MTVKVKEELSHICQIIAETVDAEKNIPVWLLCLRHPESG